MSLLLDDGPPPKISGARYSGVPANSVVGPLARASRPRPKSMRTMRPPASRITFCALMSRCSSPALCTAASARHTPSPTTTASCGPIGPSRATIPQGSARAVIGPDGDAAAERLGAYTAITLGCRTFPAVGLRRGSTRSAAEEAGCLSVLSATSRRRFGSHARYTSPNEPDAILSNTKSDPNRSRPDSSPSVGVR